jgi:hypothetical protein
VLQPSISEEREAIGLPVGNKQVSEFWSEWRNNDRSTSYTNSILCNTTENWKQDVERMSSVGAPRMIPFQHGGRSSLGRPERMKIFYFIIPQWASWP